MTEIHIHLHPDGERAAFGQIDQHFHHADVAQAALAACIIAVATGSAPRVSPPTAS